MTIVLKAGLALRRGQRTLELTRVLSDEEVQIEDVLTRRASVISTGNLLKRIWTGYYVVIQGTAELPAGGRALAVRSEMRAASGLPTSVDLSSLNEEWRKQIEYRLTYLKGLQAAHVTRGNRPRVTAVIQQVAKRIDDPSPPSSSAVMEWARRYQTSDHNPLSLVQRGKLAPRSSRLHPRVEEIVSSVLRTEYFTRAAHPLRHAYDCVLRDLERAVQSGELSEAAAKVSPATFGRRAGNVDDYHRIATREGHARARMVCRTTMDGGGAAYPLQRVEVDHTPLDWVVIDDETGLPLGRPLLTLAVDSHSNYGVGFYLSFYGPGVTSVAGVLRSSIQIKTELTQAFGLANAWLSRGLADEWVLDNGLEFHSKAFAAMCWDLRIDMTFCRVRTPWLKPHVERFFAGLNFLTLVRGRIRKGKANVVGLDPYQDAAISFSDLVRGLLMYLVDEYPFQINQRKLARPYDLFMDGLDRCPPAHYPGSEERLRLVSGLSKRLTVNQGGVELHGLPYGGPELLQLRKRHGQSFKTLCKWDPDDMGRLSIQDPEDPTIWVHSACRWADYASGLSWNQHLMIRKFARQQLVEKDAQEALRAARLRLHDHWQDATRKKDRKQSQLAAQYAGFTSGRVLQGQSSVPGPMQAPAPIVIVPEQVPAVVIPEFEAFDMEAS